MTATDTESGDDERAQSAVLGVVLLIGVVAIAAVGLLMLAADTTESIEQDAENERIEQSFVELSQTMASTASTGDTTEVMDFAAGEHGAVVKSNAGTIEITGGNESTPNHVNETFELGAIEYVGEDNTRIAYQAGGVFYETGNQSRVVSAPPIHYDFATETFSFPITETAGEETQLNSGEVVIKHQETHPHRDTTYVQDDHVDINITSPYYRGWETYFEKQAGSASIQNVEPINDTHGTVSVRIGYLEVEEAFNSGVSYAHAFDDKHDQIDDYEQASFPPLDDVIDEIVDDVRDDHNRSLGVVDEHEDLEDGRFFADEIQDDGHLAFDLSDGNATLAVDGDLNLDETAIEVTDRGDGNHLNVYVTGDYDASQSGDVCVTDGGDCDADIDATTIRIIGTSEMQVDFGPGGKSRLEGVLYAGSDYEPGYWPERQANCDYQVCLHSNPDVYGAIIASSVNAHASAIDYEYADELEHADINLYPDDYSLPPQVTYLNLVKHEVGVEQR